MNLHDYLSEESVVFLNTNDRNETLKSLVGTAASNGLVADGKELERAVLEREAIMSTGMGLGVAVPHAKLPSIDRFFIIIGIARNEIEWNSLDQKPVRIVFLIGGPDSQQKEYLSILSKLMLVIKNPAIREKLLAANSPTDVLQPFLRV